MPKSPARELFSGPFRSRPAASRCCSWPTIPSPAGIPSSPSSSTRTSTRPRNCDRASTCASHRSDRTHPADPPPRRYEMPAPTARPGRGPLIKAYAASLTGTALEYYDFAVYSAAAALVFPQLFFPGEDPLTGTLLSFSTYAVGFLARPVGGIVFGRLGDRVGRKNVLVWTLMLIGAATLLIGLLPGYASIGVAAPIILVLLRFAQGVGVGGEWGGAVLLSSEYG